MRRRQRMSKRKSKKLFSKTAGWVHPLNAHRAPMRGGFRL